ncbi:MAG: trypsin-like peptidase domain-containing protein [Clostridia bacterium]|nr:trypsin-like peptidase domain-containing protein [Clostridia bacterium]
MKTSMMKRWVAIFMTLILVAVMAVPCMAANGDAVTKAREGVVKIRNTLYFEGVAIAWTDGTGVLVATDRAGTSTDLVLTAYHVIDLEQLYYYELDGGRIIDVRNYPDQFEIKTCILLDDGVMIDYTVDPSAKSPSDKSDWALLHLEHKLENIHALKLGSDGALEINDPVWALGFPYLVETDSQRYTKDDVIVTQGTVIKKDADFPYGDGIFLLHSAPVTHGNSGGPLINERGDVVGLNVKVLADEKSAYNYATRIDEIKSVLDRLGIGYVEGGDMDITWVIVIAAIVLVVLVGAAVIFFTVKGKRGTQGAKASAEPTNQAPHLIIRSGRLAGGRYRMTDRIVIGRDPSQCNIVYPADTAGISGVHCEINVQNGVFYLRDCKSTYGTYLGNGMKLTPGSAVVIGVGTTFYLADPENTFVVQ